MSFDPKIYELVEYFTDENASPTDKSALAQEIQDAVEGCLRAANAMPQWMQWTLDL